MRPKNKIAFFDTLHIHLSLRSVQMLKGERGVESNRKLPHLFLPNKTATMVPKFAVEDLSLGRIAALVLKFAVNDLHLGRTHWW